MTTPAITVEVCDPWDDPWWREALDANPAANLGQAREWLSVISSTYSHTPYYLKAEDSSGHIGVLPAFLVRRPFLGRVMVSMPFLDSGGPCAGSTALSSCLVEQMIKGAGQHGATTVELRCTEPTALALPPMTQKVDLVLSLPRDADTMWQDLSPKVRNQVRKAQRSGLSIAMGGSELLQEFYSVFSANMRDLGSPVHSREFFFQILDHFKTSGTIFLVRRDRTPLGGLMALSFNGAMYVPWASSLRKYAQFCPNMLLYWGIIEHSIKQGFTRFCFGRSTRGSGTYHFKRQWGAEEMPLYWYSISLDGRHAGNGSIDSRTWVFLSRLWRTLPVRMSQLLGPPIRRYLTQ